MSILITGIAGFIGSHAADYFISLGKSIVGCDSLTYASRLETFEKFKSLIPIYSLDICETDNIENVINSHRIDTIINFAAETHVDNSIRDVSPFLRANIMGVASLLEVTKRTGIKLIHISTDEVYGPALGGKRYKEDSALSPQNPYSASKAAADLMIQAFKNTYKIDAGIIRPCNNFGPRQHREKLIPTILSSLSSGKKIPVYGRGDQTREWMFVKDTARIIFDIFDSKKDFDILNISTQHEVRNIDLIEEICRLTGHDPENSIKFVDDRPGHDFRYAINCDKLSEIVDARFTDFSSALNETISEF